MAAGLGTRLRPFTELEPKALLPLMGIPMAQFAVDAAVAAGVTRIVANIHHLASRAREGLGALERGGAELLISDESDELLGSAGGLRKAAPLFGGRPFFLLNADVLCDVNLEALARVHLRLRSRHGVRLTLTVFPKPPLGSDGIQHEKYREILFDPSTSLITGLGEKVLGRPYFVGAAVIDPEALAQVPAVGPSEFVSHILMPAIRDGKAGVHLADGMWQDVGSPALWLQAHREVLRALETGRLSQTWRERLERHNQRVGWETWVSRAVPSRTLRTSGWAGPAYWSPWLGSDPKAPTSLGPDAVLYGADVPGESPKLQGIGFGGHWVST